jgi:putative endonuclease
MAAKDDLGRAGEQRAARYVQEHGFHILDRNWRCAQGEIDIVAVEGSDLVVIEVKTRRSDGFGHPFEAIDARKRARLWRLGVAWAVAHRAEASGRRLRLDAISVLGPDPAAGEIEHLRDVL